MIYAITKVVLTALFKIFYRLSARGTENIGEGATILAANHTSYLDPVVVGVVSRRPVYFVAKEELFSVPFLGWYIKKLHAFPVKRQSADRQVIRTAVKHLKKGRVVLIFPEGRRNPESGLAQGLSGAAFLSYKSGARIVPTAISGTDKVMPEGARLPGFPRITVSFGRPVNVASGDDKRTALDNATGRVMREIGAMLEETEA